MIPCPRELPPLLAALVIALSSTLLAQTVDVPLNNWTVPPYRIGSSLGGVTTMTDVPGAAFVGITPCRLVDTRPASNFPAPYGPPIMSANISRDFDLNSATHCPGIPVNVAAYSLNLTVTETAGGGDVRIWPAGSPQLNVSTQNWAAANVTIANAAIVQAGTNGSVTVLVGGSNTHLIVDINGYFTKDYIAAIQLVASGNFAGTGMINGTNASTTNGSSGVSGIASGTTGSTLGVSGKSSSMSSDSAGVKGADGTGTLTGATSFAPAGVRGESTTAYGVLGLSRFVGIRGDVLNTSGASLAEGRLGYSVSGTNYGVYAIGDIGATGTKAFVTPHPVDPSLVIRYISLEGPEAGTYFRGRGRLHGRSAVIDVPESFRFVTEAESLSIQLTPIGGHAILWVTDLGLEAIAVQGSRDVEFFYTVNGVRRGYADFQAIAESSEFVPESASARLSPSLGPDTIGRLLSNGTYNADGSVNLTTAERLGWTRNWASSNVDSHP